MVIEILKPTETRLSSIIEYYNELKELEEWNTNKAKIFHAMNDHEKAIAHSGAAGALQAATVILEEMFFKS